MRNRITLSPDPDLDRELPNGRGAVVRITTGDGNTKARRVDWPKGHSRRGDISWDDLATKWSDGLPEVDIERAIALACSLEDLDDITELLRAFDP